MPRLLLRAIALLAIVLVKAALIAPEAMAQQSGVLPQDVADGAPIFITNKWSHGRLAVDQNGKLYESDPNALDPNASWELQTIEGSPGVYKIRSRLYGRYLLMDNNDLKTGKVLIGGPNDGPYAHWIFEPAQGSLRIRNVGNPDMAINTQDGAKRGPVKVSFVDAGWHSAMWDFRALNEQEKAERAALIIRQDNVPLTGMWRQVSSDFYPCPECRLAIIASRNRRVDQEGPGGFVFNGSSCLIGEARLDNTLQGTDRAYLIFNDPHPWKTGGFNVVFRMNGNQLTLRYTKPIEGTGGGQAANMPVLTETYVREVGPQDFTAANYDALMNRMMDNNKCANVPTAAQLANIGKPPPSAPPPQVQKDDTAKQLFGALLQFGLGIVANELNKGVNQAPPAQQPQQPFQPPAQQPPFQQPQFQPTQPQTFAQPSFNCGGQLNATEQRICSNSQIAQLDVQMASMYKQQRASAPGGQDNALKQQQRDWLTQRNACGGNDNCIFQAYQWRISQLSGASGGGNPVMGGGDVNTVTFFCEGGFQLTVRFDNRGQTPLAYLINAQGQVAHLVSAQSGSGARYVGGDIELHTKNDTAIITQAGREAICKSQ